MVTKVYLTTPAGIAEVYLMREDLRLRRYSAAIQRAQRLNRLAEQARNGRPLIAPIWLR